MFLACILAFSVILGPIFLYSLGIFLALICFCLELLADAFYDDLFLDYYNRIVTIIRAVLLQKA